MNQILSIAKHNLKMFFVRPWSILLLLSPIFLSVVVQQIFGTSSLMSMGTIGIIEQGESSFTKILEEELWQQRIEVTYYENKQTLREAIEKEDITLGLEAASVNSFMDMKEDKAPYKVIKMNQNKTADQVTELIENKLGQLKLLVEHAENETDFNKAYKQMRSHKPSMIQTDKMQEGLTMNIVFSFFIMMFLLTVGVSLSPLMREREEEVYTRILATPIKRYQYVLGHLVGAFTIVFSQMLMQLIAMRFLKVDFNLNNLQFIIIGIVLCCIGLAISMLILAFSKNSIMYYMIMGIGVTPLCMMSDTFFPVEFFPAWLEKLSYLSPIRWIMMGYRGMIGNAGLEVILRALVVALLMSIVMILISLVKESHASNY